MRNAKQFTIQETNGPLMKVSQDSIESAYSQDFNSTKKQQRNELDSNISFEDKQSALFYPDITSSFTKSKQENLDSNVSKMSRSEAQSQNISSNYPESKGKQSNQEKDKVQIEQAVGLNQQLFNFKKKTNDQQKTNDNLQVKPQQQQQQQIKKTQQKPSDQKIKDELDSNLSFNYTNEIKNYPELNSTITNNTQVQVELDSNISMGEGSIAFVNDDLSSNYPESEVPEQKANKQRILQLQKGKNVQKKMPPVDFDELVKEKLKKLKEKRALLAKEYYLKQKEFDDKLKVKRQAIEDKKQVKPMDTNDLQAMLEQESLKSVEIEINKTPIENKNLTKAKVSLLPNQRNMIGMIQKGWDEKQLEIQLLDMEIAVIEEVEKKKPKPYRIKKNVETKREKGWIGIVGGINQEEYSKEQEQDTKDKTKQFLLQLEEKLKLNKKAPNIVYEKKGKQQNDGFMFEEDEPMKADQGMAPRLEQEKEEEKEKELAKQKEEEEKQKEAKRKFDELMKEERERQKKKKLTELETFKKMNEREKEMKKQREEEALGKKNNILEQANVKIEEKKQLMEENKKAQKIGYQEELKERKERELQEVKPLLIQLKQLKEENKKLKETLTQTVENQKAICLEVKQLKNSDGVIEIAPDKQNQQLIINFQIHDYQQQNQ